MKTTSTREESSARVSQVHIRHEAMTGSRDRWVHEPGTLQSFLQSFRKTNFRMTKEV